MACKHGLQSDVRQNNWIQVSTQTGAEFYDQLMAHGTQRRGAAASTLLGPFLTGFTVPFRPRMPYGVLYLAT